jgi:hypothetical protein
LCCSRTVSRSISLRITCFVRDFVHTESDSATGSEARGQCTAISGVKLDCGSVCRRRSQGLALCPIGVHYGRRLTPDARVREVGCRMSDVVTPDHLASAAEHLRKNVLTSK